jgi:hypothetical protein
MCRRVIFLAISGITLLFAGCSSAPVSDARPAGATHAGASTTGVGTRSYAALQKGMTAEQVRGILGEPAEIKPLKSGEIGAYHWIYRHSFDGGVQPVVTGMQDVPYIDRMTGESRTIQEPLHGQEMTVIHETIELLVFDGQLVEWKRSFADERVRN